MKFYVKKNRTEPYSHFVEMLKQCKLQESVRQKYPREEEDNFDMTEEELEEELTKKKKNAKKISDRG